jgi:3-hydroxyisobutyrate dehydrogenase
LSSAQLAAPHLRPHAVFADLTSAAPDAIRKASELFAPVAYVDGAILGAISIHGHATPLLASGEGAERFKSMLEPFGFSIDAMPSSKPGDATSLKLVRSILTKGMDAVIVECLLVAEAVGLREALLARLGDLDRSSFGELMAMFVRTHAPNALRRQQEMEAATAALQGVGVPLFMTGAVVQRYARSVEMLGARPRLPAESAGVDLYARVVPWMLDAERAMPSSGDA